MSLILDLPVRLAARTGNHDPQRAPILRLPIEVVIQIMASLECVRDLLPLVLAHSRFNSVFKEHRQHILQGIILLQIPYSLLPLATATHKASSVIHQQWNETNDSHNWGAIPGLLAEAHAQPTLHSPLSALPALTPAQALSIEETHSIIVSLAADFANAAVPRFKLIFEDTEIALHATDCSENERDRLYRAFYRFELYSRTFGRKALDYAIGGYEMVAEPEVDEVRRRMLELFFWPWSPWANEQLACVFQYLDERVAVVFNEIAERDLEWAYCQINWVEPLAAASNRHFLLHFGLPFIHSLSLAPDYDARKRLIDSTDFPWFGGHYDELRLPSFLSASTSHLSTGVADTHPLNPLSTYTTHQLQSLSQPSTAWIGIDNVGTLPVHLWLHSHYTCPPTAAVNDRKNLLLRDAGYVFWDANGDRSRREETLSLLERIHKHKWAHEGRLPPEEIIVKVQAMQESWAARTEVYLRNFTPRRWPGNLPGW